MATSGSTDFNLTTSEISTTILQLLGVLGTGETISAEDYNLVVRQLNMMIKTWQAQGIHLWTQTEGVVFLDKGQYKYILGGSSADKASDEEIKTELSTSASAADTTLTVDATTNMAVSDKVGLVLDTGAMHWSTIASVDSSTQITINDAVPTGASAAINNHVYAYTAGLGKPLEIHHARLLNTSGNETHMREMSRREYMRRPDKDSQGTPSRWYLDRQRDSTILYVLPASDTGANRIKVTYSRQLEDLDSTADNADFPSEWLETIVYNGAISCAPYFRVASTVDMQLISARGQELLQALKGWDTQTTSLKIR